jgi:hypothetical protein
MCAPLLFREEEKGMQLKTKAIRIPAYVPIESESGRRFSACGPAISAIKPAKTEGGMNNFCMMGMYARINLPISNRAEMMPASKNRVQGSNVVMFIVS